jgi:outer membrane protein assembly factor BamB
LDNNVYALNATTGKQVWNYTTYDWVYSSPTVAGGVVYVGSDDYRVYALNATAGKQLWNYTTSMYVRSSPAVAGGLVYVGSRDGYLYALNATTGARVWYYNPSDELEVDSSPAVAGGLVFVGSGDYGVYALNATTGEPVWSYATGGHVDSSPAVAGGIVYVGSGDSKVYAFRSDHDVAVTNVTTSKAGCVPMPTVGQNLTVAVDVTVANIGDYNDSTVTVTAYAAPSMPPSIFIGSATVSLDVGQNTTLTFTWNTTGFAYGNYTISATAGPVSGETNTGDNTFTDGPVLVTIPGDINGDFQVSLADLVLLANAYGSKLGDTKWNPNADINGDGKVSLADLVLLANHYGQHYP